MRAAFGLAVSTVFGLVAGWLSKGPTAEQLDGLTAFSVARAKEKYKGCKPRKGPAVTVPASLEVEDSLQEDAQDPFPAVRVGSRLAEKLQVQPGDLIFIGHRNPIISVVRAVRARVADIGGRGSAVALSPRGLDASGLTAGQQVAVEFEM
jgi:hypothetical protein